jgi:hypothetical protein
VANGANALSPGLYGKTRRKEAGNAVSRRPSGSVPATRAAVEIGLEAGPHDLHRRKRTFLDAKEIGRAIYWLRRRDPGFASIRRSARLTLVACFGFYVCHYGLHNPAMATYALFGAFALGALSQIFGGLGHAR